MLRATVKKAIESYARAKQSCGSFAKTFRTLSLRLLLTLTILGSLALTQTNTHGEDTLSPKLDSSSTNGFIVSAANLSGYVPDDKYKLRVGDRVAFQVIEDRDAPKTLLVADSGELDFPYVGRVMVVDKTCKQLGEEL